ncbi:MAG: mechanosensitive ion channel family protein [Solobacterium sp.]|nr:mechanosensitive ion channel family protein [Solobacterium sp.]
MEILDQFFEKGFLSFLTVTIITIVGCQLLCVFCDKELKHYYERHSGRLVPNDLLSKTLKFLIWALGLMAVARQVKALRDLNAMVVGASGIAATVAGIAARLTFSNYISGFFLNIHQPFRVGDDIFLKEKGIAGTVKDITFRHTIIETRVGTTVTIPNSVMDGVVIEDLSKHGYSRPLEFRVGLNTDIEKLQEIVNEVLEKNSDLVNAEKMVTIESFDGSGYTVSFPITARTMHEYIVGKNRIIPELNMELKKNGIVVLR